MPTSTVLVTLPADQDARTVFARALVPAARLTFLDDAADQERAGALAAADIVVSRNLAKELRPDETLSTHRLRLLQFVTAGVDYIPLRHLPADLPIAHNGGAYAEPMAEHAVAMAFAAAKRIVVEHRKLERGEFDQFRANRMLAGMVCGILGMGGVGVATARRMRALGLRVNAINRRGATEAAVDWIGTPDRLDDLLAAADVLVLALPLATNTEALIGARELARMKPDAILINLARGEIVDEAALYRHLLDNPAFTACIDAWWVEPVRHGRFAMGHPFMTLANVIASPHNSASVSGARAMAYEQAAANCRRVLAGAPPANLIGPAERVR